MKRTVGMYWAAFFISTTVLWAFCAWLGAPNWAAFMFGFAMAYWHVMSDVDI